jgi:hypothetical protein
MGVYDRSSKWLIQHHGDAILQLAGIGDVESWRPLQAELVQPTQLPDGLIEAELAGRPIPLPFLIEVATYPEARVIEQAFRGLALAYLERRTLPELVVVVLSQRGNQTVPSSHELLSELGGTAFLARWRVVEMWRLSPTDLFSTENPGIFPLVPLTDVGPTPESVFRECRERIEREAPASEVSNLLAVTQILAKIRFSDPRLFNILGGKKVMSDASVYVDIFAEAQQRSIFKVLDTRFGAVPEDVRQAVERIVDEEQLETLLVGAVKCADFDEYRKYLPPA